MPCGVTYLHPNQDKLYPRRHNILGSAKCGRHPEGKLPLRGGELQLRGDFS